jgi:hypothetical protein
MMRIYVVTLAAAIAPAGAAHAASVTITMNVATMRRFFGCLEIQP